MATYGEELEERILENFPLLILVSNHRNINFAEILGEEEDQTDRAVGKKTENRAKCVTHSRYPPRGTRPSLTAIRVIVLKHGMLSIITVKRRSEQVNTCHFTQAGMPT